MNNRNLIAITGNLGADPTAISSKPEAGPGIRLSLANTEGHFNKETKKFETTHTNWVPITVFGNLAQRVQAVLKKGNLVTVFGSLKVTTYQDKNDKKSTGFEIIASDIMKSELLAGAQSSIDLMANDAAVQVGNTLKAKPITQPMISLNNSQNSVTKSV